MKIEIVKKRGILALGLAVSTFAPQMAQCKASAEKPNILFIFADDHCFNALGSLGMDNLETPNLDRLRERGVYFSHAFNQGSMQAAVSAASRNMLISGQYIWHVQDYVAANRSKPPKQMATPNPNPKPGDSGDASVKPNAFWPQYMKTAGYDTYISGKWHTWVPVELVFDNVSNIRGGMALQHPDCYHRQFIEGQPDAWTPYDTSYGGFWEGGTHWSVVLKNDALRYLSQAEQSDNPFFMYLAFNAPHDPRQSPKEYVDKYPPKTLTTPVNMLPKYPYAEEIGCGESLRDERLAPFPRTEYAVNVNRQEYFASITYMDEQIGKILDKLEQTGMADNTYIFYTADHGLSVGDHGFLGKQNMYDASMRVPLFVAGPGIPKGKQIDDMVYLQDVMATAMDIAGSEYMDNVEFQSFLPLIEGKGKAREVIYGGYMKSQRMVRTEEYQMIIYPTINVVRLYDMKRDPLAMVDLAANKKYVKTMNKLLEAFKQQQQIMGDQLDVQPAFDAYMKQAFAR